jgi:predicted metalloprotease with PDZ domain
MDAGGSWLDPSQMYINFINLTFAIKGREEEEVTVRLQVPEDYKVATALSHISHRTFLARNFQHLVDSPLIASRDIVHETYRTHGVTFHVWLQGEIHFDLHVLLNDFLAFTQRQIEAFGEFPADEYHFLIHLLPYKHYHGVEHRHSTVITIGPAAQLSGKDLYDELIGVCSHELYHFWNVCRIRPKVLLPYDFSKEAYMDAGLIAEGITTYMGDLFLLKSGYFSLSDYLKELSKMINREFENSGWQNQSIAASSLDLWLDGYKTGIPDKKVSIYNRGALISLCMDLILIDKGSALQEAMNAMWRDFGKPEKGYEMNDFERKVFESAKGDPYIPEFFRKFVYGCEDILPVLTSQLKSVGIVIESSPRENPFEGLFGIVHDLKGEITKIHPESEAYQKLMLGDKIVSYFLTEQHLQAEIIRLEKPMSIQLKSTPVIYYKNFQLHDLGSNHKQKVWVS